MKTLNDVLREELSAILSTEKFAQITSRKNLDSEIINKAFDILLDFKYNPHSIDRAKTEFENYLINTLKSQRPNDH